MSVSVGEPEVRNGSIRERNFQFNREKAVKALEVIQDFIVITLCVGLFFAMVVQIWMMFQALLPPLEFSKVTSDILFLLILLELFRLLIIYLQEHEISIGVAVEVSIVSVLREVIVRGILETEWNQILASSVFLAVLSLLLTIRCSFVPGRFLNSCGDAAPKDKSFQKAGQRTRVGCG